MAQADENGHDAPCSVCGRGPDEHSPAKAYRCSGPTPAARAYWVLREDALRRMLNAVRDGEDPDDVLIEQYANSEHEGVGDDA